MNTLAALGFLYFVVQGAGYLVHRLAHWPGGGALYRAHRVHHEELYKPTEFLSDVYRSPPQQDSSVLGFLPYLVVLCALPFLFLPPLTAGLAAMLATLIACANSTLHDRLHVRGGWLERFGWFHRLRALHLQHHVDTSTNFGIFCFLWDRIMHTYREVRVSSGATSASSTPASIGRLASDRTQLVQREFLVAVAVGADGEGGRIEGHDVLAADAAAAMVRCQDPQRGSAARGVAPLEGEVLALWNELGRVAFGFGQ